MSSKKFYLRAILFHLRQSKYASIRWFFLFLVEEIISNDFKESLFTGTIQTTQMNIHQFYIERTLQ